MRKSADGKQLSLFGPSLDVLQAVKAAMNRAAKGSSLSREQICDRMSEVAAEHGVRLQAGNALRMAPATLEKWLNPADREHVPGLRALVVFCRAVGDHEALQALAAPLGLTLIDERQAALLERAEIEEQIRRLKRRQKKLEESL